jgi:transposase-like protein
VPTTHRQRGEGARDLRDEPRQLGSAYGEKHAVEDSPLNVSDRARLRELERENRELRAKSDFLSKAAAYFASEHR